MALDAQQRRAAHLFAGGLNQSQIEVFLELPAGQFGAWRAQSPEFDTELETLEQLADGGEKLTTGALDEAQTAFGGSPKPVKPAKPSEAAK